VWRVESGGWRNNGGDKVMHLQRLNEAIVRRAGKRRGGRRRVDADRR